MKRYGEMSREEITAELERLEQERRNALFPSQAEVLDRKVWTAKSYLLDPSRFPPGMYRVNGYRELFELHYVNGIMAWGRMGEDRDASFLLSTLESV
jgi:hypothetical protein